MRRYNIAQYTFSTYSEHKKYWEDVLSVLPEPFVLDGANSTRTEPKWNTHIFSIDSEDVAVLSRLVNGSEVGMLVCLISALKIVLYKYSRTEHIGVLMPPVHHENGIADWLPVITSEMNPASCSIKDVLKAVREGVSNAIKYQDYPIEIVDQDFRNCSNVFVAFESVHVHKKTERTANESGLTVVFSKKGDQIQTSITYNEAQFGKEFIHGMQQHLITVFRSFENPDLKTVDLDILSKEEKKMLLQDFVHNNATFPEDQNIHGIFEEKAAQFPDRLAVVMEEEKLTYRELNERSNQLAHQLIADGVNPKDIIPVMMNRSLDMITTLLAILKAGAVYLPVDPDYPVERIEYTLRDSQARFLLIDSENNQKINFTGKIITVNSTTGAQGNISNPDLIVKPDYPAYIIYTSGSTGNPKGVVVRHYNVVRLFFTDRQQFDFDENDVWTMFHSFCFDFSVWEMYGALLFGGKLVLVPKIVAQSTPEYLQLLKKENVTVLNQTPGAFYKLIEQERSFTEHESSVRYVIFGGEALRPVKLKDWNQWFPQTRLVNMYGITETTVHVTYKEITPEEIGNNVSNIGKAIPTLQTYVLDVRNKLVPVGVAGELCVAGEGLAEGYLYRPELTAERFIDNPFGEGKLYKSGDLARYLPNGDLEYLGRIDHQVKIRGYRIEIGEIETALLKIEGIRETLVQPGHDQEEHFLTAYIVTSYALSVAKVREKLSVHLPDYMIPSYFVFMEEFPLTSNGKIDRKALPDPMDKLQSSVPYEAPENDLEAQVCGLFAKALKIERVGANDNFFELGGHSLKATILLHAIKENLEVEITLGQVFEFPTPRLISNRIAKSGKSKTITIPVAQQRPHYPLSSAQKRLFILTQFDPGNTTYNMPVILNVHGPLNPGKLEETFDQLVLRHESLRTTFELIGGEPAQIVHKEHKVQIQHFKGIGDAEIREIVSAFIQPFDLSESVFRVGLIEVHPGHHVLLMDLHHIISDGATMTLLTNEFVKLYSGEILKPLRLQYKDFAVWQNEQVTRGDIRQQEEYWIGQFGHDIPVLEFPLDFRRPGVQQFTGTNKAFILPESVSGQLKSLASEQGVSMYMLLLAAFNVLLSKYSGQEDIVVGSPTSGRNHPDLVNSVGVFVNTVAIRNFPQKQKTFTEFLKEVKNSTLGALENQDYQFEEILDKLDVKRDLSRNPLFDIMFTFQNRTEFDASIGALRFEPFGSGNNIAKFDMTLGIEEQGDNLAFNIEYATHLFKEETIDRIARHFEKVLQEIVAQPAAPIREIDLLSVEERSLILEQFNSTKVDHPQDRLVHQLFEQVAESKPDHIALVHLEEQWSYRKLNQKSNQLAHKMIEKGIEKGDVISIVMTPSLEMFVAILATLKAGAAYLPVDPGYPKDRIEFMLSDSKAKALITNFDLNGFAGWVWNAANPELYQGKDSNPQLKIALDDDAYVIYTSGSTGNPKGVVIQQDAFLNVTQWNTSFYQISENDRTTKYSGVGFDASIIEIFPYLVVGSTIHIVPEQIRLDAEALNDYFNEQHISISFLPTQMAEHFMQYENHSLRCLTTGGDKLKSFKKNNYKLFNTYGPTENAVDATFFEVDRAYDNIPIGKPIDNVKVFILNAERQVQPVGVPGELCLSGKSLSKGYLYNEKLTHEKFVPNPYLNGEKMYLTGDLVRWLPDGNIEFLGRIDHQVQIRGFRIELGEIENQIKLHPEVTEVTVLDKEDANGDKFLCAFFVAGQELSSTEIRQFVKHKLPEYMIPSFFVQLDQMPVTRNGKTDRKRLLSMDLGDKVFSGIDHVEPETDTEKTLVKVWQTVLGLEKIGTKDNFFELGGNSLKIVKVLKMIEDQYPGMVQIGNLFDHATIGQLGKLIDGMQQEGAEQEEDNTEFNVIDF